MMKAAAGVIAGAERSAGASQHDHLDLAVERRLAHGGVKLVGHRGNDRVEVLRPVERDRRDRTVSVVQQRLEVMVTSSLDGVLPDRWACRSRMAPR